MNILTRILYSIVLCIPIYLIFVSFYSISNPTSTSDLEKLEYIHARIEVIGQLLVETKKNNLQSSILIDGLSLYNDDKNGQLEVLQNSSKISQNLDLLSRIFESRSRFLENDLKELAYNLKAQRKYSKSRHGEYLKYNSQISDIYSLIRSHLIQLKFANQPFQITRTKELNRISQIVQNRLRILQNPPDCNSNSTKFNLCHYKFNCGFGCQIHHLTYCLLMSYIEGRTLILLHSFFPFGNFTSIFYPITNESCAKVKLPNYSTSQIKHLRAADFEDEDNFPPPSYPMTIPSEFSQKLRKFHEEPQIWWIGQFIKYILRIQPQIQVEYNTWKRKLGFKRPIVGIHVRRTDKLENEAQLHSLSEYMDHADEYFDILDKLRRNKTSHFRRKVFIATDEPKVISEAYKKYGTRKKWTILADLKNAKSGQVPEDRETLDGFKSFLYDVFLLSECDFIVCTFSSQVCRLAYELMQSKRNDGSKRAASLDDIFYFGGGNGQYQKAQLPHTPHIGEIDLKIGDQIKIFGNHWNGYSKGENLRTNRKGYYPSYKARDLFLKYDFPEVKLGDFVYISSKTNLNKTQL